MNWIDAGAVAEWRDGQTISIPVGRKMIAVARVDGAFFAIEDVCTHDGAELTGAPSREWKSFARVTARALACERERP